ncbi:Pseudouridylate synthase 7 [Orchesella cincta]|uniref:Pseudouridylate synthase 7 n=1 Tax=Orchesella cincta TaxID=48709 RepID=A0A1D2NGX3_ORCCI|nr:Pseudouridylate synthase 7 [Orchesella cincta]
MSKYTAIRSEEEVGILLRVGNQQRFNGLFKERYSDFHVNEIDLNGKIVQLGSLEPPQERKSEISVDDPAICSWIPEDIRVNINGFQERLENAGSVPKSDKLWTERIEVKVTTLDKEERTRIHKWLTNFDKLSSETIDKDGEKYIVALYETKNNRNKRRPATRAKYTHCTLYKEGVDTFEAIGLLSKKLRIKPSLITFCGTKDKHGKTTQRISISNIDASRLAQISNESRNVKLGSYEYLPHHLRLGDLKGNHFKILLRNVLVDSDQVINAAVESLKSQGFINYFGLQRFGSYEVSTHAVGKCILQMQWMEAFDLILKPKSNDQDFVKKAKTEWFTNRDPVAAIKKLPPWYRSIESNLLHGLAKYYSKNDLMGAFLRIPRNSRHLYIHSFQSFLWNQVATYRIKEMGLQPVVGDLVYVDKEHDDFYVEDIDDEDYEEESGNGQPSDRLLSRPTVKTLTPEDLENYSIYDVLIPIQGSQIRIPENGTKDYYDKLLKEEGLDSDCFLKFKPVADQPKGAYRKLLIRPHNVSHKIIQYGDADPVDTFIPSELDKAQHENKMNNEAAECASNDTEVGTKDKKCVIVEFSLPSSAYATMALREIMLSSSEIVATQTYQVIKIEPETTDPAAKNDNDEPKAKRIRTDLTSD